MQIYLDLDRTSCRLANSYRSVGGICCLHLQRLSPLKLPITLQAWNLDSQVLNSPSSPEYESSSFLRKWASTLHVYVGHIPEYLNIHQNCRDKSKFDLECFS